MFDYIKKTINSQMRAGIAKTPEMQPTDVPNEVITEYAHLFQELDDISEEGLDVNEPRKLDLDIDLNGDGDVEVDTIEIGLDGNLKDIPGDASVESITSEYETMKTYDNFYEEAAKIVPRLARESDSRYAKRVSALADKMYTEYCADAEEIGAFGFTKMSITDNRVPEKINTNFGSMQDGSNGEFVSKINTYFATDNNHEITKKQLDSARLVQNGAFKNIGPSLKAYMESTCNIPSDKSVWDYCTPTALYIPKGNGDSFCVVLEYTNEVTDKREFFGWTKPVNNDKNIDQLEKVNMESFVQESHYEWKKAVVNQLIQEAAEEEMNTPKRKFSRFYQESDEPEIMQEAMFDDGFGNLRAKLAQALSDQFTVTNVVKGMNGKNQFTISGHIDDIGDIKTTVTNTGTGCDVISRDDNAGFKRNFSNISLSVAFKKIKALFDQPKLLFAEGYIQEGIDLGTGDAGSDTDNAGGDPPPIDNSNTDQSVDTSSASDAVPSDNAQPSDGGEAKETAAVNNVSDQIAAKIADQTKADATDDEDITFSDDTGSTDTTDGSYDDFGSNEPSTDETESVDDQLDDLDNASNDGNDEFGSDDSLDDGGSIENGEISDIENMSLEEIMNNASDKLKTMPLSEIKEFLNNNSTADFQEAFILTKKNINKEVDIHLRKALGILNDNNMNIDKLLSKFKFEGRALNRVLVKAAKTKDVYSSDEQEAIKKLNTSLGELMVSLKKSNDTSYISSVKRKISDFTKQSKIVAAFVEDKMEKPVQESFLLSNINDKITKSLIPVKADMMDLYEKHQANQLTRGRIIKKYASNSVAAAQGTTGRASNMGGSTGYWSGVSKSAKNIDSCLKLLNKALRKKDVDNVELITDLADKIDLISDYIETVIDDKNENKEYIKLIGKLSGEILELINQFIGDDESTEQEMSETSGFDEETSATPDVETADDIDADEAVEETPDEDTDTDEDTVDTDEEEVEEDDE